MAFLPHALILVCIICIYIYIFVVGCQQIEDGILNYHLQLEYILEVQKAIRPSPCG